MSNITVNIDELANAVADELEKFSWETHEMLKKEAKKVTIECKDDIKKNAASIPVGKGPYAHMGLKDKGDYINSWGYTTNYDKGKEFRFTVHAKKNGRYRLTHLLEKGHAKWLWGVNTGERVPAYPHIEPAEKEAESKLTERVKVRIRNYDYS